MIRHSLIYKNLSVLVFCLSVLAAYFFNNAIACNLLSVPSLREIIDHDSLLPYKVFRPSNIVERKIFVGPFAKYSNVGPENLEKMFISIMGIDVIYKEKHELDVWKEIISQIENNKIDTIDRWKGEWEGFECGIFAKNAQDVLRANNKPFKNVVYDNPQRKNIFNHHYTIVSILGVDFIMDTSADQFEIKAYVNSYHPYKYYYLGVVLIPLEVVRTNSEKFWMYKPDMYNSSSHSILEYNSFERSRCDSLVDNSI